jgi:hypothetical protein
MTKAYVIQNLQSMKKDDVVFVNAEEYSSASDNQEIAYKTSGGIDGSMLRKYLKVLI